MAACPAELPPPTTKTSWLWQSSASLVPAPIVDTGSAQAVFIPKVQAAILRTGGADRSVHHEAGTIRQVADSLARQEFGAHAFTQEQDFRTEMVGLLTRTFSQIGAADPPWKP